MKKFIIALIGLGFLVALCVAGFHELGKEVEKENITLKEAAKQVTDTWTKRGGK